MKLMDIEKMTVTACTDETLLSAADQRLLPIVREAGLSDDFLSAGLKSGRYKSREIQLDHRPVYVLYFFIGDKTAYFVAGAAVSDQHRPDLIFEAFEIIKREFGCNRIVFNTKRAGLVKMADERGWISRGVTMEKIS